MMMASCPSSPSWKRCALLKSRFSQIRLLRVNKGLQPSTSHIFGESDEPNNQEISRFIKITFRDRGRSIFCYIDIKICKYRYLMAWLRKRGNQMEGNQHLWNNHHFPWILVALVKSSSQTILQDVEVKLRKVTATQQYDQCTF